MVLRFVPVLAVSVSSAGVYLQLTRSEPHLRELDARVLRMEAALLEAQQAMLTAAAANATHSHNGHATSPSSQAAALPLAAAAASLTPPGSDPPSSAALATALSPQQQQDLLLSAARRAAETAAQCRAEAEELHDPHYGQSGTGNLLTQAWGMMPWQWAGGLADPAAQGLSDPSPQGQHHNAASSL